MSSLDDTDAYRPSKVTFWHGLTPAGDGILRGNPITGQGGGVGSGSAEGFGVTMMQRHASRFGIASGFRSGSSKKRSLRHWLRQQHAGAAVGLSDGGDGQALSLEARQLFKEKSVKQSSKKLTRLQTVQQLFHSLVNRTEAYDHPHRIALVLFGSEVSLACGFTPLFDKFKQSVDQACSGGDTVLFDALDFARKELQRAQQTSFPGAKVRCLVLSDGKDTKSSSEAHDVAKQCCLHGVVVDAVSIGTGGEENTALRGIVAATGGLAFRPGSLHDALRLCELETVQALRARPPVEVKEYIYVYITRGGWGNSV
jgi:hypothetical protein